MFHQNTTQVEKNVKTAVKRVGEYVDGIKSLQNVTEEILNNYVLPKDELIDKRNRYVLQYIERLTEGCKDLQRGDLTALGKNCLEHMMD
jgi:galactokinase